MELDNGRHGHCTIWGPPALLIKLIVRVWSIEGVHSSIMMYELWDLVSRNMIDWFEDQPTAIEAVCAYLDADEADLVLLIVRNESGATVMSATGLALSEWASRSTAAS